MSDIPDKIFGGIIPRFAEVLNLLKKGATLEAQKQILELQSEVIVMQEEIQSLNQQITQIKADIDIQCRLKYEAPLYWLDEGSLKDGPFCQCCYDTSKKLIRLIGNNSGHWQCKACKNDYKDKTYTATIESVASADTRFSGYQF